MKYLKNNEPMSSLTHFAGFGLSIAGLVLLVLSAVKYGNVWHVVSFSIFGSTMVLLYLASTLYHALPKPHRYKNLFLKIDLSFIFILIAGTYTPLTLVPIRGAWGFTIFGIIWGLALMGVLVQVFGIRLNRGLHVLHYLFMGWLIIIAYPLLSGTLSSLSLMWLLLGGFFYTVGIVFFVLGHKLKKVYFFGMHEIFHIFVMAGSFSHFWLMYKYIAVYS